MIREQKKEGRRRLILHSAEALVREVGSTEFSMRELAARASLSPATIYNLFGSKATVLYALLNRSLDRVNTTRVNLKTGEDPIEHVFQAADVAVDLYTADARFNKPLQRFLLGEEEPEQRAAYMKRAFEYWEVVLGPLFEAGLAPSFIMPDDLARDLQLYFAGVLIPWTHGESDDSAFRAQIRYGVALRLLSLGNARYQPRLEEELRKSQGKFSNAPTIVASKN